ncbi:toll/interleukin-1 receptor domain-containing protein [Acetobacter lovaniensis]|uniref:TIR domain-containing protein n=1 Tax=Acetobacter lovaniensis TaxID=104100 RepID=A0A841QJ04_9PROT|nr:toll/interleukin-1 receptor domain-containing protein [Acetobacter lovaniensis]MBB6458204.1 hypothetical protein [Acetobacter lovaniensis]NHN82449.1 TIR domain-containing protein [Acetobacter lovaniensis]GBQ64906.1 hypothetical protein AA0474_0703 [Acetobacter lovaniensis NRIC 0474]
MNPPLSLTGNYQLVVLGQEGNPKITEYTIRLIASVQRAFDNLGVNQKKFLINFKSNDENTDIDRRMPTVAVFFGLVPSPVLSNTDSKRLKTLLDDGILIIPIVENITNFSTMVTPEVAALNGCSLADCGNDFERLAARILEGFGLLREKRRLFISYRRVESSGVATQLYEALDAAGFDVFLDTQGVIRPGEPFQEILWHRLADTDVAVVLDTPNFLASRWTEEELARANTSNIQLLQILWPGQTEGATAAFSMFHPLSNSDFVGSNTLGLSAQLKDLEVSKIVDAVEGLRARAFGARHAFLVREFAIEARSEGMQVLTTLERNLILAASNGSRTLVMPAIGIPDAERYEWLGRLYQRDLDNGSNYAQPPILLYDQTGIRSRWLQHLEWLNDNIACARSLSITDAKKWLSKIKGPSAT